MRGGRLVTETTEFWSGHGVMKSTQCHSVKEQVSGAWPIWYMEVMPDFKTTQRGLANLSSPLSTQHTMMTLKVKDLSPTNHS